MFAPSFFPQRYYAPRYFPPVLDIIVIEVDRTGGTMRIMQTKGFQDDRDIVDILEIIAISGILDD